MSIFCFAAFLILDLHSLMALTAFDHVTPITIDSFVGRLGNNILQIINAFHAGISTGLPVYVPSNVNPLLQLIANRTHEFDCAAACSSLSAPELRQAVYYCAQDLERLGLSQPSLEQQHHICTTRLASLFVVDASVDPINTAKALVVHVRSGDVFSVYPHTAYWQPPLSYYVNISVQHTAEHGADAPLIAVTEPDFRNPVIAKLRELDWHIWTRSVQQDFSTLLRARHLGLSHGTFSMTAALCSTQAETIYVPVWNGQHLSSHRGAPSLTLLSNLSNRHVVHVNLGPYAADPWKNTAQQQRWMIDYAHNHDI